jgi:hypothetical protein
MKWWMKWWNMRKKRNKICPACRLPMASDEVNISCSEHHIKCIRCGWPVAKKMIGENGICFTCRDSKSKEGGNKDE